MDWREGGKTLVAHATRRVPGHEGPQAVHLRVLNGQDDVLVLIADDPALRLADGGQTGLAGTKVGHGRHNHLFVGFPGFKDGVGGSKMQAKPFHLGMCHA